AVAQARISVMASRVLQGRRGFQQVGMAVTDDQGEFRVARLPTGRYIVCAAPMTTGGPNTKSTYIESCYPGPPEGGAASAMEIPAGREAQVNFTLQETPVYQVRGTLTGGPKTARISVSLQSRELNGSGRPGVSTGAGIGPDGGFRIFGVAPGEYTIACDYWEENLRLTARVPVTVGSSDVEGVAVHLEPAIRLTGVVQAASAKGTAAPAQPWSLSLRSEDPAGGVSQAVWQNGTQSFTIPELPAGTYRLNANPPSPFYVKSAMLDGRDLTREAIPLARSGGRIEVTISDDSGSIEGSVKDQDGQIVAGASVMASAEGREPRFVPANAEGRFRFDGLPPGDYAVTAWNDLQPVEYADSDWMNRHARPSKVSVAAGQTGSADVVEQVIQ
ncbi:MAG: carboxypeptidase regulatory-like domain-containing protein, partial [Acidobacteriota bacterium]|nr:carboxypeptidase regulatory-like domain-containing protein [Acidobacteriota bacterium]